MAKRNYTDAELEAILNSLEGIQKAVPEPFFYTRLKAKMMRTEDSVWSRVLQFVSKPAFAVAAVFVFLLINGYILFNQFKETSVSTPESAQTLALEYTSLSSSFYENIDENP